MSAFTTLFASEQLRASCPYELLHASKCSSTVILPSSKMCIKVDLCNFGSELSKTHLQKLALGGIMPSSDHRQYLTANNSCMLNDKWDPPYISQYLNHVVLVAEASGGAVWVTEASGSTVWVMEAWKRVAARRGTEQWQRRRRAVIQHEGQAMLWKREWSE